MTQLRPSPEPTLAEDRSVPAPTRTGRGGGGDPDRRRAIARRRGAALLVLVLAGVGLALTKPWSSPPAARNRAPAIVRLVSGDQVIAQLPANQLSQPGAASRWLGTVPATTIVRQGNARIALRQDPQAVLAGVQRAVAAGGGTLTLPRQPVAATIHLPVIKQLLRNNCETAALSTLLLERNVHVGQLALQRQVAHARPLNPKSSAGGQQIWGDPSLGFVGQADGYGYGVYQAPIAALAREHGLTLSDLSNRAPQTIYDALLAGHPVMAWVGLSAGPYATWRTPAGATVRANFGEHSVVLTGLKGDKVSVNDPLSGQRLTWTKSEFERMWAALGHRALEA